jgi:hypothetical protein
MVIDRVALKIMKHHINSLPSLSSDALVNWRFPSKVLDERNLEFHFSKIFWVWLGNRVNLLNNIVVVRKEMEHSVTKREDIVAKSAKDSWINIRDLKTTNSKLLNHSPMQESEREIALESSLHVLVGEVDGEELGVEIEEISLTEEVVDTLVVLVLADKSFKSLINSERSSSSVKI